MNPYVCVVGAVNLDICGRPSRKLIFRDSNPGTVTLTPGGVGRNIAHDLRLLGAEVKFLTAFGGDSHAQLLRNDCVELGSRPAAFAAAAGYCAAAWCTAAIVYRIAIWI